jgi:RNA polymerase-binding transcription factor DksA
MELWDLFKVNVERTLVRIEDEVKRTRDLILSEQQTSTIQLRDQIARVLMTVQSQQASIIRLQATVSVLSHQLLVAKGTLDSSELERKVDEIIASTVATQARAEQQVRQAKEASANAAIAEAMADQLADESERRAAAEAVEAEAQHRKQREEAKAQAPVQCVSCGNTLPYRQAFMSPKGLLCGSCFSATEENG